MCRLPSNRMELSQGVNARAMYKITGGVVNLPGIFGLKLVVMELSLSSSGLLPLNMSLAISWCVP